MFYFFKMVEIITCLLLGKRTREGKVDAGLIEKEIAIAVVLMI